MIASTVTDKGQTTVPREVREALGIRPRQRLQWSLAANGTVVVRAERSPLALFGSLKSAKKYPGLAVERAAAARYAAEQVQRKKSRKAM